MKKRKEKYHQYLYHTHSIVYTTDIFCFKLLFIFNYLREKAQTLIQRRSYLYLAGIIMRRGGHTIMNHPFSL